MNTKTLALAIGVIGAATFAAESVGGDVHDAQVEIPTIIVEATRIDATKADIASHVDLISKSDIEVSGAQSTVELLEKRGNIFLRKMSGNPALAAVSMRGYGANSFGRVKILVDGEELNNPDMAAQDLMRVPVRSIERVEVLHGPQTIMHGEAASSGVINIITGNNSYEKKSHIEVHGGNLGQVGVNLGTRGGFEAEGLTYFADLDYDRGDGWRKNAFHETWTFKGGFRQNYDNGSFWGLKSYFSDVQYGLPGGIWHNGLDWDDVYHGNWKDVGRDEVATPKDRAHNQAYGINIDGEGVINEDNKIAASFGFRNRDSRTYYKSYGTQTLADIYTYDWKLKYTNSADIFGHENRLDIGTDHKLDVIGVDSGNHNHYMRYSSALFARDEFFMTDDWSAFAGIRGEWFHSRNRFRASYGTTGTDSATKFAPAAEIGTTYHATDNFKLFARASRFYHAPLADELFSYYGTPNMSLKPEQGYNFEAGFDLSLTEELDFNFTAFHTELKDEIMYAMYKNRNMEDRTRRDGFETSLVWSKENVATLGLLYSYTYARFSEGANKDNDIPMVPRQQVRLFGDVYVYEGVSIGGGYRFVGAQRLDSDFAKEADKLPAYGIFDTTARYKPTCEKLSGLTFAFTIDNLLDKKYADYGVYNGGWGTGNTMYPACGRSYQFSVRYEF